MTTHVKSSHQGLLATQVFPCGARCGDETIGTAQQCNIVLSTPTSIRVHKQHCVIWQEQHVNDPSPPESPPNTGKEQETLDHLLFNCRCPEIVRLRQEYANTFSAPTASEWLATPHSARFVFVALEVIEQRKKEAKIVSTAAAGATNAANPPPKPSAKPGPPPPPSSSPQVSILRRPLQTTLNFGSKDGKT